MTGRPRWFTEHDEGHSAWYADRFRRLAARGADLDGEARFVDALLARGSRVLDAGCGGGRTGAALHARGHRVVGVDADAHLIEAARADYAGPRWVVGDLTQISGLAQRGDLTELVADGPQLGGEEPFDAAVLAGNVMVFLTPGTEWRVLEQLASVVRPEGVVVTGFATDRDYSIDAFDTDCVAAGLQLEHRFATWDLRPWHAGADWAVSVLRRYADTSPCHSSSGLNP